MGILNDAARPPLDMGEAGWRFAAAVDRWIDGDTVDVNCLIDVGFGEMVTKRRRIRLLGINAPELHSSDPAEREAAHEAWVYAAGLAPAWSVVTVDVVKFDKYGGRDDGWVVTPSGSISALMLEAGLAAPYDGGPRS